MNKAEFLKMVKEWYCEGLIEAPSSAALQVYEEGALRMAKWWATELLKVFAAPEAMDFKHKLDELRGLAQELLEDEKK